jgi:type I restriction enzyme, S subunit
MISVSIGEIASLKYGKMPPREILADDGFPVFSGYRITGYAKECTHEQPMLVVVARGVGGTGDVKISPAQSWITNLSIVLELDEQRVDKLFLYYRLQLEPLKDRLNTGAAQAQITIANLSPYRITLPVLETQKKIVDVIRAYDDLIANNRRRIELLEHSARHLFKEWFIRLRYPGHEHDGIVDRMPEGWETKRIEEVADTIGGGTPSSGVSNFWDGGDITWFVPSDVTKSNSLILLDSERKITEAGLRGSSARMVPRGAILMTSRASVGFFGLYDEGDCCTNQGFISIAPQINFARFYMLQDLLYRREEIISKAGGTTYKEINKTTFRNLKMIIPSERIRREFEEICSNIFAQVRALKKQSVNAEKARDILLPRLMDGRISV